MRVYEIAKQLGVTSKEILSLLEKNGIAVKNHMVQLDDQALNIIQNAYKTETSSSAQASVYTKVSADKSIDKQEKSKLEEQKIEVEHKEVPKKNKTEEKKIQAQGIVETPKETTKIPAQPMPQQTVVGIVTQDMTVESFADAAKIPASQVIVMLLKWGIVAAKNKIINKATVERLCQALNIPVLSAEKKIEPKIGKKVVSTAMLQERPPVVVVIGHVDHGKTTLLDFIRKTKVAAKEKGGITQHLGAYEAKTNLGTVVFLDTPGHEAFSKIRQRGVRIADIAILVVAADDGVKPQTIEAIKIAQEMHTPIVVALNKIDKVPESQIEVVKQQLMQYGVVSEEWGGESIIVPISAKTGQGVDLLLEMVILQSQMMELRADLQGTGNGYILESKMEKGRGPVATVILQSGTLHKNDYFSCGSTVGHVNTMIDSQGKPREKVGPSIPVQISGFDKLPNAGDYLTVFSKNEYLQRKNEISKAGTAAVSRISHGPESLRIILKADNDSSREALIDSIEKHFKEKEKGVTIVSSGIGNINESDVELAYNTGSEIYGLHVKIDAKTMALANQKYVSVHTFDIIYRLFDAISAKLEAGKEIVLQKVKVGEATVIKVFDIKKIGQVAGCRVNSGKIVKGGIILAYRGKEKIGETKITSLQKEKESVSEVRAGFECGIVAKDKSFEWHEQDRIECFIEE